LVQRQAVASAFEIGVHNGTLAIARRPRRSLPLRDR
jgi:hypothetical protein